MTQNQIAYANKQESARHNIAVEEETKRYNTLITDETKRHNLAMEALQAQGHAINATMADHSLSIANINANSAYRVAQLNAQVQGNMQRITEEHYARMDNETYRNNKANNAINDYESQTRRFAQQDTRSYNQKKLENEAFDILSNAQYRSVLEQKATHDVIQGYIRNGTDALNGAGRIAGIIAGG